MAVFKEPSLVLFKFNPAQDLRDYLKKVDDFQEVAEIIKMVAVALRALHQSTIALRIEETLDDALGRYRAAQERVIAKLAPANSQRSERARQFFIQLVGRAATLKKCERVPIHGAFGWDCILYGDEKFYFYRFEECRRSHPGFDVGSFLADLRRFYLLRRKADQNFYHAGREFFLETYFAGDLPAWREDVPFFVASAMFLRLDRLLERPQQKWQDKVDAFLEQCERIIRET
ncbi:MAG: phosphotransferase [bacterium]